MKMKSRKIRNNKKKHRGGDLNNGKQRKKHLVPYVEQDDSVEDYA